MMKGKLSMANFIDRTTAFSRVNATLEKIKSLNEQRKNALNSPPDLSIYRGDEQKRRLEEYHAEVNRKHDAWLDEERKAVERQIQIRKQEIAKKRHPDTVFTELEKMGGKTGQSDSQKIQSALEINNALLMMQLNKTKYPTAIVKSLFDAGKVELANTLIDTWKTIPASGDEDAIERESFYAVERDINRAVGATPLLQEILYLERAQKEIELSTSQVQDKVNSHPLLFTGFVAEEMKLDKELQETESKL